MTTHLILQTAGILGNLVEHAAAIANANSIHNINSCAVRLVDVDPASREEITQWAAKNRVDTAFINHYKPLAEMKVLAMDMDSTLINIECIDEIADMAGRKQQVSAITEAAMRGEIKDFSESLRRRVALLEGVPASALEKVYEERLRLNPGAEKLVQGAKQAGLKVLLVSGGFTFFTQRLQERLGLDETHANTLEVNNGVLTGRVLGDIVDGQAKANYLQALAQKENATPEQCIAMGDGANDLIMMGHAAYSVAYRAKPVVQEQAAYSINYSGLDAVLNWFS
ncbi:MAG: phosphoserine phosphatase SerB [Alcaligenaceae bacterium]|nr:phosphoserine phosphatase SerB [Alcaligenaceae bacterium]